MEGYYSSRHSNRETGTPTGRLSIEVKNIPAFRTMIEQAKQEVDQLWKTINQLQHFELDIDFSSEPTSFDREENHQ